MLDFLESKIMLGRLSLINFFEKLRKEEKGGTEIVAIILIIIVLIAVVVIFRNELSDLVTNLFDRIGKDVNKKIQ